mgnify:CR=1 FL=1
MSKKAYAAVVPPPVWPVEPAVVLIVPFPNVISIFVLLSPSIVEPVPEIYGLLNL